MQLSLEQVGKMVGPEAHLYPMSLSPAPGDVTVLLGATQAGKTSLMRIMAGLDTPTRGRVLVDNKDVSGVPVRQRNVAMVYQQFINYPSMRVYDNIASPLKLAGIDRKTVDERVRELAAKLHIEVFLDRLPAELSGGQQQRVALARALAKDAPLMLLDEPLVNLDYKLREELREELSQLFSIGSSTVVYATTEPAEALMLGGHTAVMDAGELLQYGPTAEVFHYPASVRVARAFSDPPMNLLAAERVTLADGGGGLRLQGGSEWRHDLPPEAGKRLTVGIRASALRESFRAGDISLEAEVELAEISGSDTFIHAKTAVGEIVAQLTGVHEFDLGEHLSLHVSPNQIFVFDESGALQVAPERRSVIGGLE